MGRQPLNATLEEMRRIAGLFSAKYAVINPAILRMTTDLH